MTHLSLPIITFGVLLVASCNAAVNDCVTYMARQQAMGAEVQTLISDAFASNKRADGPNCRFRNEAWSIHVAKHTAWCQSQDAQGIETRLTKMSQEVAACRLELATSARVGADNATPRVASTPPTRASPPARVAPAGGVGRRLPTNAAPVAPVAPAQKYSSHQIITRDMPAGMEAPPMEEIIKALRARDAANQTDASADEELDEIELTVISEDSQGPHLIDSTMLETQSPWREIDRHTTTTQGFRPPDPDTSIHIISATWGANCPGATPVNDTENLAEDCGGYVGECEHRVRTEGLHDPARQCDKAYKAVWQCGKDPQQQHATARRDPAADRDSTDLYIMIRCNG